MRYETKGDSGDATLSLTERWDRFGNGKTNYSLPLFLANGRYADRVFARC